MLNQQQWAKIKSHAVKGKQILLRYNPITSDRLRNTFKFIRKSWKSIAIILPGFLALYYIVGSWATNNIDKSPDMEILKPLKGLSVAETSAALIKREVDDKMWTPNLPIVFPGYVLDNMPEFQLGVLHSVRIGVETLAQSYESDALAQSAKLLGYPGNIWLLSKTENLALAPSSGAQYRKARKFLLSFNREPLKPKKEAPAVLKLFLKQLQNDAGKTAMHLGKQVREYRSNWVDFKADNVFYQTQGRIYGYYILLKALAEDFKPQILDSGQYEQWTSLNKTLTDALALDPLIVRNGEPDSLMAPNHLLALGYYLEKARSQMAKIAAVLEKTNGHLPAQAAGLRTEK